MLSVPLIFIYRYVFLFCPFFQKTHFLSFFHILSLNLTPHSLSSILPFPTFVHFCRQWEFKFTWLKWCFRAWLLLFTRFLLVLLCFWVRGFPASMGFFLWLFYSSVFWLKAIIFLSLPFSWFWRIPWSCVGFGRSCFYLFCFDALSCESRTAYSNRTPDYR